MQLLIGDVIKCLRRKKDITQEELSEILGVSCQSVSRWENNACYPDIELLPTIANFFGITVDNLLGVNEVMEAKKVEKYLSDFQDAISCGNIEECVRIARAGVAEYPNNYVLLDKLMYALFVSGDDDGNIPNWAENQKKYDAEITSIGERIMKYCPDQDIRLQATARLAFNHCEMGRKEIGRTIYETLPSQEFCKESQIWGALRDDEKLPFLHDKIKKDYESLKTYIGILATSGCISDKESICVIQKVFELEKLVFDGKELMANWKKAKLHYDIAKCYVRIGETGTAIEHLKVAADAAIEFDHRPETEKINCLLLGTIETIRTEVETADSRPLCEIMRDKWLTAPDFDPIKDTEEIKKIMEKLSRR